MKLISTKDVLKSVSGTALIAMVLLASPANAADPIQCKGLANEVCSAQATCSWVESYERKDGRTVNAFCRTKAKPKSTSAASQESDEKAS